MQEYSWSVLSTVAIIYWGLFVLYGVSYGGIHWQRTRGRSSFFSFACFWRLCLFSFTGFVVLVAVVAWVISGNSLAEDSPWVIIVFCSIGALFYQFAIYSLAHETARLVVREGERPLGAWQNHTKPFFISFIDAPPPIC